jgi:hypothetical protein
MAAAGGTTDCLELWPGFADAGLTGLPERGDAEIPQGAEKPSVYCFDMRTSSGHRIKGETAIS